MTIALCVSGWAVAALLVLAVNEMRGRLELVAAADHELRGPATAIGLAAAALRREPGGPRRALAFEAQLDRMRVALSDLEAARSGARAGASCAPVSPARALRRAAAAWAPAAGAEGRSVHVRSELGTATVLADAGRLAQALGNLVANALEHGSGAVELLGRRSGDRILLEVRDRGGVSLGASGPGRGRGLGIASAAVAEAGGRLTLRRTESGTVAAVELPLASGPGAEPPPGPGLGVEPPPGPGRGVEQPPPSGPRAEPPLVSGRGVERPPAPGRGPGPVAES